MVPGPDHFLSILAAAYIGLFGFFLLAVLDAVDIRRLEAGDRAPRSESSKKAPLRLPPPWRGRSRWIRYAAAQTRPSFIGTLVVVSLIASPLLAGWQGLNGSFFPSRSFVPLNQGNGVPNWAPFDPVTVDHNVRSMYRFLAAASAGSTIYWPSDGWTKSTTGKAIQLFNTNDPPQPTVSLPELTSILRYHELGSLGSYLRANGVSFLVVSNLSPYLLGEWYGVSNYSALTKLLNLTPGLALQAQFGDVRAYHLLEPGHLVEPAVVALSCTASCNQSEYSGAYGALGGIGLPPAILPAGETSQTLTIGNSEGNVSILSPSDIAPDHPTGQLNTTQAFLGNTTHRFNATQWTNEKWTQNDWSNSAVTSTISNGSMHWVLDPDTTVSLSYNGTLATVPGGIVIPDGPNSTVVASLSFEYQACADFSGNLSAVLVALDPSGQGSIRWPEVTLPSHTAKTPVLLAAALPATSYFTPRIIVTNAVGCLTIWNTTLKWSVLPRNDLGPFGDSIRGGALNLSSPSSSTATFVGVQGNGTLCNSSFRTTMANSLEWIRTTCGNKFSLSGDYQLLGVVILRGISSSTGKERYLLYNYHFLPTLRLMSEGSTVEPVPTIDGTNAFLNVPTGDFSITFAPEQPLRIGYAALLVYFSGLVLVPPIFRMVRAKRTSVGIVELEPSAGDSTRPRG